MPKCLRKFLLGLNFEQAEEIWKYLDSADAPSEMIELTLKSHPTLSKVEKDDKIEVPKFTGPNLA